MKEYLIVFPLSDTDNSFYKGIPFADAKIARSFKCK